MPARKVKICAKCGKDVSTGGSALIIDRLLCFDCWDAWRAHSNALFRAELDRWVEQEHETPA